MGNFNIFSSHSKVKNLAKCKKQLRQIKQKNKNSHIIKLITTSRNFTILFHLFVLKIKYN